MCLVVSVVVAVVSATAIVLYPRDVLRIYVTVIFVRIFVLCCVFFFNCCCCCEQNVIRN